ncbi:MAG: coxB [Solirubrobacterales bacterium]|nr:coxB [Solirubrobacterales bacterium]
MRRGKTNFAQMAVVGAIASAVGIAGGLLINWFPSAASTQSGPIDTLWDVLLVVSIPVFVIVTSVVLFSVKWFRVRPGEEQLDGEPIHGNTRLEVIWTAIPSIIIAALVVYAYLVLHDIEKAPANAAQERHVHVQARQFAWQFRYAEKGADGKQIVSDTLYLPEDESVMFDIDSNDVLHDFWVPNFRMKIDAVPGITTHYRVTPNKLGKYSVVCAELCGLGHAFMRTNAVVLSRADFDKWVSEQGKPAAPADGTTGTQTASADGKKLFVEGNGTSIACGACHTLADAGTTADTGPDLDKALADADAAMIKQDIVDPNADIYPGYPKGIMPGDFGQTLSPAELDALVNYLDKVTSK